MAFKEVQLSEEEQKSGLRKFRKFDAIGDKHVGLLVKVEQQTKTFKAEEGPKTFAVYVFWDAVEGEFEITPPTDLDKKLKKAMRPGSEGGLDLVPGRGHVVAMKYDSTLAISGRSDPMKLFKLLVDTAPTPTFLRQNKMGDPPPSVLHALGGGATGQKAPDEDDDIPF